MISLTLAQLTHVLDGELHLAPGATAEDLVSGGVDTDSRLIEPGGIFVAKPGEVTDGHLFVDAAVAGGAVAAIVEHVVAAEVTQVVVADAIAALADLARHVVASVRRAGDLRIVGITGSNGKTTTKNLLARILEDEGETVAPRASFNNEVGAPLTMLRVTDGNAVPRERIRCERTRRDRTPRRTRRARCRSRADGGHGARRWIRRDRSDVRGEIGAGSGGSSRRFGRAERRRPARRGHGAHRGRARRCGALVRARRERRCARGRCRGHRRRHPVPASRPMARRRRCICACSASTTS